MPRPIETTRVPVPIPTKLRQEPRSHRFPGRLELTLRGHAQRSCSDTSATFFGCFGPWQRSVSCRPPGSHPLGGPPCSIRATDGVGLQVGWRHKKVVMQRDAPLLAGARFWHWGGCRGVCRTAGRACSEAGRRICPCDNLHPALLPALGRGDGVQSGRALGTLRWHGWDLRTCCPAPRPLQHPSQGGGDASTPRSWVPAVAQPWQHHQGPGRAASAGRCQAELGRHSGGHMVLHISIPAVVQTLGVPPRRAP